MKVYVYSSEQARRAMGDAVFSIVEAGHQNHEGTNCLSLPEGLDKTVNQFCADWYFLPYDIGHWERHGGGIQAIRNGLPRLPYWMNAPERHFFFMHSDYTEPIGIPSVIFRQSTNRFNKDPNTVAFPAAVDDFGYMADADFSELPYKVCFVGQATPFRMPALRALKDKPYARIDGVNLHWGAYEDSETGKKRREIFKRELANAQMGLAPRGGGSHSFRFFEIMSAGRVPIMISDIYERPFEDVIDYDTCSFTVPEYQMGQIDKFIESLTDIHRLQEMGRCARKMWSLYLSPSQWDKMIVSRLTQIANSF